MYINLIDRRGVYKYNEYNNKLNDICNKRVCIYVASYIQM